MSRLKVTYWIEFDPFPWPGRWHFRGRCEDGDQVAVEGEDYREVLAEGRRQLASAVWDYRRFLKEEYCRESDR